MNIYTFRYEYKGEQITTGTFQAGSIIEAKRYASLYKFRELKKEYSFVKLNSVKITEIK